MRKYCLMALACLVVAAGCPLWAATPSQVGNYTGTLKLKVSEALGSSSEKLIMFVTIDADNNTTVTLNGVVQISGDSNGFYGATEGILVWSNPAFGSSNSAYFATAHFKNGAISGKVVGTELTGTAPDRIVFRNLNGKFKLKKVL